MTTEGPSRKPEREERAWAFRRAPPPSLGTGGRPHASATTSLVVQAQGAGWLCILAHARPRNAHLGARRPGSRPFDHPSLPPGTTISSVFVHDTRPFDSDGKPQ
jgi:hypothetical protein